MPTTTPEFVRYEQTVAAIRNRMALYAQAVWAATEFTDEALATLVELMVPKVLAAQLQVARYTAAYFARVTGTTAEVSPAVTQGRGTPPKIVYGRPIITTRSLVAEKGVEAAKKAGGDRLQSLVATDVQMAKIRQADVSLSRAGVTYYRRVPKGSETCAMCLIASTRRYKVGTLSPIHPGCDCGVDLIPPGEDLDEVINADLLEATHAKVAEFAGIEDRAGTAVDYRKLLVTHEHGELGPILGWRDQKFTGPGDIPVDLDN